MAAAGCQWARLRDPVPAALATSRKLSGEGNELLERKQPEKAEAKLAEAVKVCPTDCDARRYYAEILWFRNARPEAVAQLEEACRLNPDCDLRVRLAEMYLEMGQLDAAHAISTRPWPGTSSWLPRGGSGARVLRATGDRLAAAGDRGGARAAYLQALADLHRAAGYDPANREVIGETAAVYRSVGQPQRALESMQTLAETYSPGEEPQQVLYWIGMDYMALHRYDDAAASLSRGLIAGPPHGGTLLSPGRGPVLQRPESGRRRRAAAGVGHRSAARAQPAIVGRNPIGPKGGGAMRR